VSLGVVVAVAGTLGRQCVGVWVQGGGAEGVSTTVLYLSKRGRERVDSNSSNNNSKDRLVGQVRDPGDEWIAYSIGCDENGSSVSRVGAWLSAAHI
jgi:hypothetical protein